MKRIVLTVGTNPLPLVVAARRLWLAHGGPTVVLLHSHQTRREAMVTERVLRELLDSEPAPVIERACLTDAFNPRKIEEDVRQCAEDWGSGQVYLHLTGGTVAMVFYTARALSERLAPDGTGESYLSHDAHRLFDGAGDRVGGQDERTDLELTMEQLAALHQLDLTFRVTDRDNRTHTIRGIKESPAPQLIDLPPRADRSPNGTRWQSGQSTCSSGAKGGARRNGAGLSRRSPLGIEA